MAAGVSPGSEFRVRERNLPVEDHAEPERNTGKVVKNGFKHDRGGLGGAWMCADLAAAWIRRLYCKEINIMVSKHFKHAKR